MKEQSVKRISLENCTFVKTFLMILVVLYHCSVFWAGNWFNGQEVCIEAKALVGFSAWLNSFHIYGFTLVSGYLFQYLKNEKKRYQEFKLFALNKAERLLIPYCFACVIWVVPISATLCSYSVETVVNKYIFCTSPSQLWFLWMLFDVFVIVWPLSKWLKNDVVAVVISLISWGIGLIGGMIFPNVFCIWMASTYLPYFILGMKLREKKEWFLHCIPSLVYFVAQIILFVLWQFVSQKEGMLAKVLSLGSGYVVHVLGALMAFFVLQWLATKVNWKNNKIFMAFSKKSMPIYLFHQQIIYFTIIWLNGKVNPYINVAVNFIVALVVSFLISAVLMKFKCTRFLIGEK